MRLGPIPETLLESLALRLGIVPVPLVDTILAMLLSRAILTAVTVGVFEAIRQESLTAREVALKCDTNAPATEKLLNALVGARYVDLKQGRYRLGSHARKWLLQDSKYSLHDAILWQSVDAAFIDRFEEYVRTGKSLDIHQHMTDDQWDLYQRGMRSGASLPSREIAWRTTVPAGARRMLDIGGSHGYYSVALCRRHPELHSIILELPEAISHAERLLSREGMDDRITYRAGDARTSDLGTDTFDLIFIVNLIHHFDLQTNRDLIRRAATALRRKGVLVIGEINRPLLTERAGQVSNLLDLFFATTSSGGTWSIGEIAAWQRESGLIPMKPIRLITAPGASLQTAVKVASQHAGA